MNDSLDIDPKLELHFNGIDAATGDYLFEPLSSEALANLAQGKSIERASREPEHLAELKFRNDNKDEEHFGVKEGIDATQLDQAGWGVIFPAVKPESDDAREQAAILEALSPLLALRRAQSTKRGDRYKEYTGVLGYRPGESKQKYLARLGAGPGPADPDKVPYYLLIVASPQVIPYHVQYQIDVQYAVGRLHFDTIEEYANYARSVVAAETGGLALAREVAFVGVANPDDPATQLSRKNLVGPLADMVAGWTDVPGWSVARYFDEDASKAKILPLLGGPSTPALLFSGSHGMGFRKGDPLQERHQGALLLQDWAGPKRWRKPIGDDLYLSGDDLSSDASPLGMIAFNFACYGAGTPEFDEFSKQAFKERKPIADRAFVAGLHRKLLGHPKGGALATIGHVERAWGYSFMWGTGNKTLQSAQLGVFESTLKVLMKGMPVGMALEYFNERYAEMASDLSQQIEELEFNPGSVDAYTLANLWTSSNDARGYAVVGDPAVRLALADPGGEVHARDSITLPSTSPASPNSNTIAPEQAPSAEPDAVASPTQVEVAYGLFRRDKPEAEVEPGAEPKPSAFQSFAHRVLDTLGKAIDDAVTLEVRTYVSSNASAAAAADRDTLARDGDLRAFTRIRIDGDMDVIVPERDGEIDRALWELHLELVKQAQAARAETIKTLLSAAASLIKG